MISTATIPTFSVMFLITSPLLSEFISDPAWLCQFRRFASASGFVLAGNPGEHNVKAATQRRSGRVTRGVCAIPAGSADMSMRNKQIQRSEMGLSDRYMALGNRL